MLQTDQIEQHLEKIHPNEFMSNELMTEYHINMGVNVTDSASWEISDSLYFSLGDIEG